MLGTNSAVEAEEVLAHSHLGRVPAARWIKIAKDRVECFLLDTGSECVRSHDREDGKPRSNMHLNSPLQILWPKASLQDSQPAATMKLQAIDRWENEGRAVVVTSSHAQLTLKQIDSFRLLKGHQAEYRVTSEYNLWVCLCCPTLSTARNLNWSACHATSRHECGQAAR